MFRIGRPDDRRALVVVAFGAVGVEDDQRLRVLRARLPDRDVVVDGERFPGTIRRRPRPVATCATAAAEAAEVVQLLAGGLGDATTIACAVQVGGEIRPRLVE